MSIERRGINNKRAKRRRKLIFALIAAAGVILIGAFLYFSRQALKTAQPIKYKEEIMTVSEEYGLDPCLVAAVINTESGFDPDAVSKAGAIGLMQLMPSTAEWAAGMRGMTYNEALLTEPQYNIELGCWVLNYLLKRYNNERYALIAYNAGSGTLESWLKDESYLNENGELVVIPYGETSAYVDRIEKAREPYRKVYGEELDNW